MSTSFIEIYGWGHEIIIGSINESFAERISIGRECIKKVLERDLESYDDVLHMYGPDILEVDFIDQAGNSVFPQNVVINYEPCWETIDRPKLVREFNSLADKFIDAEKLVDDLMSRNFFSSKSESISYLIQIHSESGYWGRLNLSCAGYLSRIYAVSVEIEGMEDLCRNMLLGFLVKEDKNYCFSGLIANGSTEVKSREYYLFRKNSGIIWRE